MIISFKPVRKATQGQSAIADSAVGTTAVVPTAVAPSSANSPRRDTLRYVLQLLSRFVGDQQRVFVLGLIMLIAEAATSIFESYPLAYLIDYLNGERVDLFTHLGLPALGSPRLITIAALPIAIVLIAMINSLGDSLAEIYLARGGRTLGYNMRLALYTHLQRLSLAFHGQRRTGDTLTRVTADVSEIESFVISSLSDIAGSLLVLVGTMGYLIYQSWQVALVAVIVLPIMVGVSNYFSQHIKVATKKQRTQAGELASATQEMLTSIRVIQTYSPGNHELARFARFNQKSAEAALQAAVLQARFSWVIKVLEAVTVAVTVWVALWLMTPNMAEAGVTTGKLVLFIAMINNMFKPTRKIIKEWNTIGKIYASVERIGELLDRKPTVEDLPGAVAAPPFRGQVEFQDVSFAYQADPDEAEDGEQGQQPATRQVLKDVRFTVGQGEVMALVGYTGAGKSTILQLLPRLYDPSAGRIQIDGRDIRNFTLESLRGQIGVVLQETVLFGGSVADNIAYGRPDATREQIIQAAVQANAHEFIEKLPDGYDTLLGERGANLSGGQRQRIAIARAFVRNAPILILDEPTTGLDAQSAELVLLALRLLMRGKTTIIVSHDLKLVRQAHKIAVLKDGRIEEMGTHQELLERQGTYAMLHVKQYGKQAVEEEPVAGSLYDLLQSPVFQQKWPAAQTAFDGEAMQSRLQAALFGGEAGDHQILRCKPGKASFVEGKGCLLRYDLQVLSTVSGRSETIVLLARLFAEQEAAERYLRKRLLPLVGRLQGRPELALFTNPVALFDDLNLVVSPFPLDGELPALIDASDTGQMAELFGETLPDAVDGRFAVEACAVEAGHYGRQHRCVLRYTVTGRRVADNEPAQQVAYGKVAADDRGKLVGIALTALHRRIHPVKSSRPFRLPRILGYRPNLHLMLLEAIPGQPLMPDLIQARLKGADEHTGPLTLEQAIKDCAQIAAALHRTGIQIGNPRTFQHELEALRAALTPVQEYSLALALRLQIALRRVESYAEQTLTFPLGFSHGDFTYTQLLFDAASCGLVDFDTVCEAEPALDLGQFQAYLRLAIYKAQRQAAEQPTQAVVADDLCTLFVNAYARAGGYHEGRTAQLRARVAVYEIISLLRIVLHSWQKMKSSRLELVVDLLEERLTCLP